MTRGNLITREEHSLAPAQDLRPAMRDFARVARPGDRLWRPSRWYAKKASGSSWGHNNRAVVAPTGAAPVAGVADRDRRAALNRNLVHLPIREEPDPLPVGREEGVEGILRPR